MDEAGHYLNHDQRVGLMQACDPWRVSHDQNLKCLEFLVVQTLDAGTG